MFRRRYLLTSLVLLVAWATGAAKGQEANHASERPLLLVHMMPWFEANESSRSWGWHWTMNAVDPGAEKDGKQSIASHFHPVIGAYDSGDPNVLEYQLLTMKIAGLDGVIVDWYGMTDFRDYKVLHRNTERIFEASQRLGLKYCVCYEDQTISALSKEGKLPADARVKHAVTELNWLDEHWLRASNYVRVGGKPVLLSFGNDGLTDAEWAECLQQVKQPPLYFSEHRRRDAADGGFDWPIPSEGLNGNRRFESQSKSWRYAIPVVYPRFVDFYAQAKLHDSYGKIEDDGGKTFRNGLEIAHKMRCPIIQFATWNDWGEGTQIEPSREYGYRDLELVQAYRRKWDGEFRWQASDLAIPDRLYRNRMNSADSQAREAGDQLVGAIRSSKIEDAHELVKTIDRHH